MASQTFTSSGTFTAPTGVTSIDVEVWAGGGAGGGSNTSTKLGQSGGGGAYSKKTSISVTPGNNYTVTIGAAASGNSGANGNGGNDSKFNDGSSDVCLAKGGIGGTANVANGTTGAAGGNSDSGVGDTKYSGGIGGSSNSNGGGGGGGGAGSTGIGGTGGNGGTFGGTGGNGTSSGGGGGGDGGGLGTDGNAGSAAGGGGGGAGKFASLSEKGGNGARGKVIITYTPSIPVATSDTATNVAATTATARGNITDTGGENATRIGCVYDTSSHADPGNTAYNATAYANNSTQSGSYSTGTFNRNLTSLSPGTVYYYRTLAVNSSGTDYSDTERSFTTLATCDLTGTITSSALETDIVTGGKTIILTLTGDTWVASGATFDAQRQNIINGIDSAQSGANGWDAVVKATQAVTGVVRTSNTVVTITLDAFASYDITATETVTATIPATALTSGVSVVASPTFTITAVSSGGHNLSLLCVGT